MIYHKINDTSHYFIFHATTTTKVTMRRGQGGASSPFGEEECQRWHERTYFAFACFYLHKAIQYLHKAIASSPQKSFALSGWSHWKWRLTQVLVSTYQLPCGSVLQCSPLEVGSTTVQFRSYGWSQYADLHYHYVVLEIIFSNVAKSTEIHVGISMVYVLGSIVTAGISRAVSIQLPQFKQYSTLENLSSTTLLFKLDHARVPQFLTNNS